MKTITDVVRLLGQERHENVDDLANKVYAKCKELGIVKTKAKQDITIDIVKRIISVTLSNIRSGTGRFKGWSYRTGKGYLKMYDNATIDALKVSKDTLDAFECVDYPQIKVRVEPKKEGLNAKIFYQTCKTFTEAVEYNNRASFTNGIFLSIGKILIPLDESNIMENYK